MDDDVEKRRPQALEPWGPKTRGIRHIEDNGSSPSERLKSKSESDCQTKLDGQVNTPDQTIPKMFFWK